MVGQQQLRSLRLRRHIVLWTTVEGEERAAIPQEGRSSVRFGGMSTDQRFLEGVRGRFMLQTTLPPPDI